MRTCLMLLILLIFIPFVGGALAGEQDPTAARWGITTKKNLENLPSPPKEEKTTVNEMENGHAIPMDKSKGTEKPSTSSSVDRQPDASPDRHSPDKAVVGPAPLTKQADHPTKGSSPDIEWASEKQEEICQSHLSDLRKLFLETRHLSIQGASCETAVSASRFLQTIDKCEKDCPTRFLEVNGYSNRIVRNIRFLEKLGHDRCDGQLSTKQSD